ncbi:GNAT family N-acetyltransferase [Alkalicoccobacillus murimartini]|uniref:N-acetyltransferase YhbS n=1 Tax=Alkalicoccobacillus murimartini TaxID=171685 RepID=A0ABT9YCC3_9BACI|nr:GNAT family N-acetyltransferase [Alkalicoccobacillus murimartini]MDQ0205376.1 putative N-acetyltransferase YhbS [Alkalicoccobacillus murimartini]
MKKEFTLYTLKKLSHVDSENLINLSTLVGWDYDEQEINTVFNAGEIIGCMDSEDRLLASAAIIQYNHKTLYSIGMVIVHPDHRGLGLGRRVTESCLDAVSNNDRPVMLIATEQGKPLYEKMGFRVINYVHKYTCLTPKAFRSEECSPLIFLYRKEDFQSVVAIDEQAFGDKRECFLDSRIRQSEKCVVLKNNEGEITGYGMAIQTPQNLILGPIVSESNDQAITLMSELLRGYKGKVRIDVVQKHEKIIRYLEMIGFTKVAEPPVMALNHAAFPKRNGYLVAIAAQIFG